jgi:hypothetical protein
MPSGKSFKFSAILEDVEAMFISSVIYIPATVMKELPKNRVRVKGKINGAPFALAVQYRKEGRSFFVVSKPLRKAAQIEPGQKATVEFTIVSDKVEIPEEMLAVLAQDDEGAKKWKQLTTGLQRSLCHYVTGVKNVDSRIKRALMLINKVKQGGYDHLGGKKKSTLGDS